MSPEAQRIAIAEACGWRLHRDPNSMKWIPPNGSFLYPWHRTEADAWRYATIHMRPMLPDFCYDLNAMHMAEETLKDDAERDAYSDALKTVTNGWKWHATAQERANAFCMILDLRAFIAAHETTFQYNPTPIMKKWPTQGPKLTPFKSQSPRGT